MDESAHTKPNGSAYAAHLAGINQRNAAAKAAGKARRVERELKERRERAESERLQERGLRPKG